MQWMNPEISLATQLHLEANLRTIRRDGPQHPEATADYCSQLLRQNVMQQAIIRSATRYILELETAAALASVEQAAPVAWWKRLLRR